MHELRERFLSERSASPIPMLSSASSAVDDVTGEYIEWLERKVTELDRLCRDQAEMLYSDPTKLPEAK